MIKINLTHPNPALISIIEDPEQIITLDANFLIPPDRSSITKRGIGFEPPEIIIHEDSSLTEVERVLRDTIGPLHVNYN